MKPRIKLLRSKPILWVCTGEGWSALGGSPRSAYSRWESLTRLAREDRFAAAGVQVNILRSEFRGVGISRV